MAAGSRVYARTRSDTRACTHAHSQTAASHDLLPSYTWAYRQCSSGLQAIADVAASIRAGFYKIGLAGGVETMSSNPMA